MAESELLIRVSTSGTASIEEIRKNIRELGKERDKLSSADLEHINTYNAAIKEQRERVGALTEGAITANGRMMKSYFSLGQELRQYYMAQRVGNRTLNEVTRTAGEMGQMFGMGGLGGVVGNLTQQFQQMEFAVSALGMTAKRGTGAIASMGNSLMGLAVPLGAVVAGIGLLVMAEKEAEAITTRLNKAFADLSKVEIAGGRISLDQQIKILQNQLATLKKTPVKPEIGWSSFLGAEARANEFLARIVERQKEEAELQNQINALLEARNKRDSERIIAGEKIYEATKEELEEEKRLRQDIFEIQKLQAEWQLQGEERISEILKHRWLGQLKASELQIKNLSVGSDYWMKGYLERELITPEGNIAVQRQGPGLVKGRMGGILSRAGGVSTKTPAEELADIVGEASIAGQQFTDTLTQGLSEATDTLAQGFVNSFQLGNTLLGQFTASILASMSQLGTKYLLGGLMSQIPGFGFLSMLWQPHAAGGLITEPVLGVGMRTGSIHTFAERGPEYVSPNPIGQAARYGGGASMAPSIHVVPIVNNMGLAVQVEIGNRQNTRKRIR